LIVDQLEPGGCGLERGAEPSQVVVNQATARAGNCQNGGMCRVWQVVVKVYGVATTRPQGQSRAPRPSTEQQ